MVNWQERLDRRVEELAKASRESAAKKRLTEIEKEVDVARLRELLQRLKVVGKLADIRRLLWKEGQIKEVVEYNERAGGMDVSLQLFTTYPELEFEYQSYPGVDFFGKPVVSSGKVYFPDWNGVYIAIGVTNVHSVKDTAMYEDRLLGDYIYASFGKEDRIEKLGTRSMFFGCDNRIRASLQPLKVENFIENQLLKFTQEDKLPSSLGAAGKKRINQAKHNGYYYP